MTRSKNRLDRLLKILPLLSLCVVCDDHFFKDERLFYRFRRDDGTYQEPANASILAKGQRLYSRDGCVGVGRG